MYVCAGTRLIVLFALLRYTTRPLSPPSYRGGSTIKLSLVFPGEWRFREAVARKATIHTPGNTHNSTRTLATFQAGFLDKEDRVTTTVERLCVCIWWIYLDSEQRACSEASTTEGGRSWPSGINVAVS